MKRAVVLVLAAALLATGCGGQADRVAPQAASPSATATADPAAAAALQRLKTSVADLGAVRVSGGTSGSPVAGRRTATSNLVTHEFSAVMQLGGGEQLRMLRQSDTVWTQAPPSYFVNLGYTPASARAARGKWVAADASAAKVLVDALDPAAIITSLLGLDPDDGLVLGHVASGPLQGLDVLTTRQAGAVQRVYFTPGPRPVLRRVTSTRDGHTTSFDVAAAPARFHITPPSADDVLQSP